MSESLGDAARLVHHIRCEYKYDEGLPEKAVHKMLYLANKKLEENNVPAQIPYFWYRYGTLSPLPAEHTLNRQPPETPPYDDQLREIAAAILDQYYSSSLEELTDHVYQFAPYEVQRDWRELDKKLRTHHPEYTNFYDVEPSRHSIRESVKDVYTTFPLSKYPEYETDLTRWYAAITREVYNDEMSVERMMDVNVKFWGVFSITLAKAYRHEISLQDVSRVLSVNSLDDAQEQRRRRIRDLDAEGVQDKFAEYRLNEVETRAASALSNALFD